MCRSYGPREKTKGRNAAKNEEGRMLGLVTSMAGTRWHKGKAGAGGRNEETGKIVKIVKIVNSANKL